MKDHFGNELNVGDTVVALREDDDGLNVSAGRIGEVVNVGNREPLVVFEGTITSWIESELLAKVVKP